MRVTPAAFLPHLKGLRFEQIDVTPHLITLTVAAVHATARCPVCRRCSTNVHSYYTRTVADLPWSGIRVMLCVHTRRFVCSVVTCVRKIFCERLTPFVAVYGRRTHNVRASLERIGLALAGRAGARLAAPEGTPTRRMTQLRLVRALPCPAISTPAVVGVDDFARRKGRTYASIVCDLERHCLLDLLPDASADTWAAWLAAHPSVTTVSRDRGQPYAEGTTRGAPTAVQVADRWHLLRNVSDALERVLAHEHAALRAASADTDPADPADPADTTAIPPVSGRRPTRADRESAARQAMRTARYEEVRRLSRQGHSYTAVAQLLHLHRATVSTYAQAQTAPVVQRRRRRRPIIDAYRPYLDQRWQDGCHSVTVLLHEIRAQGYRGSYITCANYIAELRPAGVGHVSRVRSAKPAVAPRHVAWLFLCRPDTLTDKPAAMLARLCTTSATLATAYTLVQRFAAMARERQGEQLDTWIQDAAASGIAELRGFADGLRTDKAAVQAGLTLPWSQGQTEGFVNKVKMLKRQMFGRAKLDLLRQRVLLA